MNPYLMLGKSIGTTEAMALSQRLAEWHDGMVAHERLLRVGYASDGCDDDCPHAEARPLWTEALATFGTRAGDLRFLRTHASAAVSEAPLATDPASVTDSPAPLNSLAAELPR